MESDAPPHAGNAQPGGQGQQDCEPPAATLPGPPAAAPSAPVEPAAQPGLPPAPPSVAEPAAGRPQAAPSAPQAAAPPPLAAAQAAPAAPPPGAAAAQPASPPAVAAAVQPASPPAVAAASVSTPAVSAPTSDAGGAVAPGSSGKKAAQQKTPFQKEALEAAFSLNQYPTEDMKRVLGEKIGLSAQQVGTWFTHRRRKAKDAEIAALAAAQLRQEQERLAGAGPAAGPTAAAAPQAGEAGAAAAAPAVAAPAAVPVAPKPEPQAEPAAAARPAAEVKPEPAPEAAQAGAPAAVQAPAPAAAPAAHEPAAAAPDAPAAAPAPTAPATLAAQAGPAAAAPSPAAAPALAPSGAGADTAAQPAAAADAATAAQQEGPVAMDAEAAAPSAASPLAAAPAAPAAAAPALAADAQQEEEPLDEAEQLRLKEYLELLEAAKAQLQDGFREDGPPLGFEFDEIPLLTGPSNAGVSTGSNGGRKRKASAAAAADDDEGDPDFVLGGAGAGKRPKTNVQSRLAAEEQRAAMLAERARVQQERLTAQIRREQEKLAREKERADAKVAKEREKELARLEGERRKHLERVMKEQKREEERRLKEAEKLRALQAKEERKLQALQEKERERQEKLRQREEKKREKEALKAMQAQEKKQMRLRQREAAVTGPKDDADIEWEGLLALYRARHGLPPETQLPADERGAAPAGLPPLPQRPPFPPPSVALAPLFPAELEEERGSQLLTAWSFLHAFGGMLGLPACTADELLAALAQGTSSRLLATLHTTLIRLIQADMEEQHAIQYGPYATTSPAALAEQRLNTRFLSAASVLEEAWTWGFDVDGWRAHLDAATWPEVARQLAVASGLGRRRPRPRREEKPKIGQEGEDTVQDDSGDLKLRLPSRLGVGTVKAAAWQVLAEAGPEGMHVEDVAREIQKRGFRDLRSSKTPEASVAGALGRDVLFVRTKAATFALQAIVAHYNQQRRAASAPAPAKPGQGEAGDAAGGGGGDAAAAELRSPGGTTKVVVMQGEEGSAGKDGQPAAAAADQAGTPAGGDSSSSDEEEEEEEGKREEEAAARRQLGEPWVEALRYGEYGSLSLDHRVAMLGALCHLAIDSPSIRETLERRMEEQQRIKRQSWEEARAEKRRRQIEAAAKAQAAAEEAQKALQRFQEQQQQRQQQQEGGVAPGAPGGEPAGGQQAASPAPQPDPATATATAAPMDVDRPTAAAADAQQPAATPGAAAPPAATSPSPAAGSAAAVAQPGSAGPASATAAAKQEGGAAEGRGSEAERARQRLEHVRQEMEANSARMEPLGMDRRYNKYWRLPGSCGGGVGGKEAAPEGAGVGDRLLLESQQDGSLLLVPTAAALDALMAALERRGARESGLYASLLRHRAALEAGMPAAPLAAAPPPDAKAAAPPPLELPLAAPPLAPATLDGRSSKKAKEEAAEAAAAEAAAAAGGAPLRPGDPAAVTRLKLGLLRCQRGLPAAALSKSLSLPAWQAAVRRADSLQALRTLLGELEAAIEADRLHPQYLRKPPLVRGAWLPTAHEVADALTLAELPQPDGGADSRGATPAASRGVSPAPEPQPDGGEAPLAWLPATVAALTWRLLCLDASLLYGDKAAAAAAARERLDGYLFVQRPAGEGVVCGQPLGIGGRIKQTLFPPLPRKLLYGPRCDFTFPHTQFKSDVATGSDALVAPAAGRGGRGRGRGRGRGGGRGRGRGRGRGTPGGGTPGGAAAPGGGRGKKPRQKGVTDKSALAKEWEKQDRSDSERHYGTDFEEEGDEFASPLPPRGASTGPPPSGPPSTAGGGDDEDEDEPVSASQSEDEAVSSEEEEG